MASYVEHIQYVTPDLDALVEFYCFVFGWRLRGRGTEVAVDRTYQWVHVGTDDSYVAFRTPYNGAAYAPDMALRQTHFGVVVDDMAEITERLDRIGCNYRTKGNHPYRDRIYVRDPDENEIEIIRYRSDKPHERNDYAIDDIGTIA